MKDSRERDWPKLKPKSLDFKESSLLKMKHSENGNKNKMTLKEKGAERKENLRIS